MSCSKPLYKCHWSWLNLALGVRYLYYSHALTHFQRPLLELKILFASLREHEAALPTQLKRPAMTLRFICWWQTLLVQMMLSLPLVFPFTSWPRPSVHQRRSVLLRVRTAMNRPRSRDPHFLKSLPLLLAIAKSTARLHFPASLYCGELYGAISQAQPSAAQ